MTDFVGHVNSPLFQVHVSERRSKSDVVVQFIVTIITLYITLMTAWLVFNMKVFKCLIVLIVSNNCRPIDNLTQRASSCMVPVLSDGPGSDMEQNYKLLAVFHFSSQ